LFVSLENETLSSTLDLHIFRTNGTVSLRRARGFLNSIPYGVMFMASPPPIPKIPLPPET